MEQAATTARVTQSGRAEAALSFARTKHGGQRRKQDGQPFIEHPIAVAQLLADEGFGESLVATAYMHDLLEKTDATSGEIAELCDEEIAAAVESLSEDPSIADYGERKRELRRRVLEGGRDAALVFAADRLANIRDWRGLDAEQRDSLAARLGTDFKQRFEIWREDLAALSELDPSLPFLAEVEIELRRLLIS